jgi:membrane protease subunit HflK
VEIEDVALSDVRPPALVKQAFLDVSNARAERSRLVSEAQTVADRLHVQATATVQQLRDEAAVERQTRIAIAHGESERFLAMQQEIPTASDANLRTARRDAKQRLYLQTVADLIPIVRRGMLTEGERPIDISVWEEGVGNEESISPRSKP